MTEGELEDLPPGGIDFFRERAKAGEHNAQYYLGIAYDRGIGVPLDKSQAIDWYTRAAQSGEARAQRTLGFRFLAGEDVEKNIEFGFYWLLKAANSGCPISAETVAKAYRDGLLVAIDPKASEFWYRIAALKGRMDARMIVSAMDADLSNAGHERAMKAAEAKYNNRPR